MSYATLLVLSVAVILTVTVISVPATSLVIRVMISVVIVSCWPIGRSVRCCGTCVFLLFTVEEPGAVFCGCDRDCCCCLESCFMAVFVVAVVTLGFVIIC